MKKRIYIFPSLTFNNKELDVNPYMSNLFKVMSQEFIIINKDKPTKIGHLLDVYKYIFSDFDYMYFNWIESVPEGKFGIVQFVLYYVLIIVLKLRKIKMINLMHNKRTHDNYRLSNIVLRDIIKRSDYLITHAKEGIEYANKFKVKGKVFYIPLPFTNGLITNSKFKTNFTNRNIDILIWGSIEPYKGILEFLKALKINNQLLIYTILIIGKISSKEYENSLIKYRNKNINIQNRVVKSKELHHLIQNSKAVIFPYQGKYVLSSGALVESLELGAMVIGPNVGAFKDLSELNLVITYTSLSDLINKLPNLIASPIKPNLAHLSSYIEKNLWVKYPNKIKNLLLDSNSSN